jgi:hypothetical protein
MVQVPLTEVKLPEFAIYPAQLSDWTEDGVEGSGAEAGITGLGADVANGTKGADGTDKELGAEADERLLGRGIVIFEAKTFSIKSVPANAAISASIGNEDCSFKNFFMFLMFFAAGTSDV